ncbi:hypothetical protein HMPREF1547_02752 [Blautia sp. KLE 1732]|nr:hypothetical protein HMPREF1547_02752 [Blautia sp. KLE 1732]
MNFSKKYFINSHKMLATCSLLLFSHFLRIFFSIAEQKEKGHKP